MNIDPRGPHGPRTTLRSLSSTLQVRIKRTDGGAQIDFSDGRTATLVREPHVASDTFIAATVQWTRRHGAAAIEIEI